MSGIGRLLGWALASMLLTGCGGATEAQSSLDAGSDDSGGALDAHTAGTAGGDRFQSDAESALQDAADAGAPELLPATCSELLSSFPPAPLESVPAPSRWALSSAPHVLADAYLAGRYLQYAASCPIVTIEGDSVTISGGCSTKTPKFDGEISGKLTGRTLYFAYDDLPAARTVLADVTYHGWTVTSTVLCGAGFSSVPVTQVQRVQGTVHFHDAPEGGVAFDVDLTESVDTSGSYEDGCTEANTIGHCYSGSAMETDDDQDGVPERVMWNGTGTVGDFKLGGVADATTADELLDYGVCQTEAASGNSTLSAGAATELFQYDGATDCSPQSTVTWALDGVEQGELDGVSK